MRTSVAVTFVVAAAAVAAVLAETPPQTPARDAPVQVPRGTAVISGTVVSDDADAKPLRLATIRLSGSALPTGPVTVTDDAGRFVFPELPAGRYSLSANKPGWIDMDYGAKRPGGSGMPIVLESGGRTSVTIRMPKGAAISGVVTTADGEPVSTARVFLFQYSLNRAGVRQLSPPPAVTGWHWQLRTDDRGAYRFYGLPAGEYFVSATADSIFGSARALTNSDFDWVRTLMQPGAIGAAPPSRPAGQSTSFAPIFYPGTADPSNAQGITVAPGEDRAGIDFVMHAVATATVSGVVLDPGGQPARGVQAFMVVMTASIFVRDTVVLRVGVDGHFAASGVLPGQYTLAARGSAHDATSSSADESLWAMTDVSVDGRDLPNLEVRLLPGMTVSGRVVFAGTSAKPPSDMKTVRAYAQAVGDVVQVGASDVPVNADGTFTLTGISPGRYRVGATVPSGPGGTVSPWTLRSSIVGGVDAMDVPIEIRAGGVSDAVVTFTDQPAEIGGTMIDAAGKPTPSYFIVVFSTDRGLWSYGSRRVKSTRPGNTGTYRIAGLPPGEYYVAAVTDFEQSVLYTPAFLEPLIASSFKITLGEGEKKAQDLQIKGS